MLSAQFRLRGRPHVRAYMGAVDGLCRQAEGACAGRLRHHAKMARGSWTAARTEMATLVAIGRHFGTVRTGSEIPGSSGRADMGFAHGGKEIYVGVCSHVRYYAVAALPKAGITTEEGVEIFWRAGARDLREAGVPTVCVIGLDGLQAGAGVTRTRVLRGGPQGDAGGLTLWSSCTASRRPHCAAARSPPPPRAPRNAGAAARATGAPAALPCPALPAVPAPIAPRS